ncbi:hypothetical protein IE81DRAFT_319647 [Ceraceosorus guamensis]|uniref:Ribonuclease H2 subunit B wHTH domain-containing protein n=1 Tax=Ceraceosorus guamensis TaxID=1522189 RepID=A0A316W7L0_9BASI|nr:hypothetical protein IE81DRAFT_319647 [Ceraceosorus guamensis]PWN45812.1 hypothetical protein IE81DRAFT_319647 [Ceraceosorus guamensis]
MDAWSMYELQAVRPLAGGSRSWFLTPKGASEEHIGATSQADAASGQEDEGSVVSDGALHIFTPIDPLFVLLPIYSALDHANADSPAAYLTLEDLLERASSKLYAEHARGLNAQQAANSTKNESLEKYEEEGEWEDVQSLASSKAVKERLEESCEVMNVTSTLQTYRPSASRVLSLLRSKLSKLENQDTFEEASSTLGRQLVKAVEADATGEERAAARRNIALDTICAYLDEEWKQSFKRGLQADGLLSDEAAANSAGG